MDQILTPADLDELRQLAESEMEDTLLVQRPTGRMQQNPTTWLEEPQLEVLFSTAGSFAPPGGEVTPRVVTIGGVERVVLVGGVKMPVSGHEVRSGDQVTFTDVGPKTDPVVLGKTYRVVGFGGKSTSVVRRLDVVEL